jgi:hypothetical protein
MKQTTLLKGFKSGKIIDEVGSTPSYGNGDVTDLLPDSRDPLGSVADLNTSKKRAFAQDEADENLFPNSCGRFFPYKEIRSVIVVARKSSHASETVIQKLRMRSNQLYQFFQIRIHPTLHNCMAGDCQAEYVPLTFIEMSSNTDMSTSRRKDLEELRQILKRYDREPNANSQEVAILCSNEDGLFTNAEGVAEFFSKFDHIQIVLYIFLGGDKWERYDMADLLAAIADFRAKDYAKLTPSHQLLLRWVGISLDKEMQV